MTSLNKKEGSDAEETMPIQEFKFYLKPENKFEIVTKRWGTFTLIGGAVYIWHLFFTVMGVDKYTDITRKYSCNGTPFDLLSDDQRAENSRLFDTAIILVTIFHMIEWLRWTVFLTTALVNVNLLGLYYVMSANGVFGIIVMLVGIITRYSGDGANCVGEGMQPERANYLAWQILCIIVLFPTYFVPIIFLKIKGTEWCHEVFLEEPEEDDD